MPRFEYECYHCGEIFPEIKSIPERDNCICPKCQSKNVKRLPAAPPFHLKGTGWTQKKSSGKPKSIEKTLGEDTRPRAKI